MKLSSKSFTLLELLIAISIFSIIAIVLYSAFGAAVDTWRKVDEAIDLNQQVRTLLDRVARDLRNSIYYSNPKIVGTESGPGVLEFVGEYTNINFPCLLEVSEAGTDHREIFKVNYDLTEEGKVRRTIISQKSGFNESYKEESEFLEGLKGLNFQYAYETEEEHEPYEWRNVWEKEAGEYAKVPRGCKISIEFGEGRSLTLTKTVFIPHGELGKSE